MFGLTKKYLLGHTQRQWDTGVLTDFASSSCLHLVCTLDIYKNSSLLEQVLHLCSLGILGEGSLLGVLLGLLFGK